MKKNKLLIFSLFFIFIFSFITFAEWIHSEKINKWLWRDAKTNTIPVNTFFWAYTDSEPEIEKMYHAGIYGFIDTNMQLDENTRVNEKGEVVKNNEVVMRKKESNVINKIPQETETNKENTNDDKNIIMPQNTGSGRLLKNHILSSQNVEILNEKTINGSKKNNVMCFNQNGAFVSVDTKKYNKIIIKAERDKSYQDYYYELKLIVNGEEEDSISFNDDEYEIEQEFTFSLNDDVDLVLSTDASYNQWSKKGLYITNGRMSKYKED